MNEEMYKDRIEELSSEVKLCKKLLGEAVEELHALKGERHWWVNETACNYKGRYKYLVELILRIETLLGQAHL